MTAQTCTPSETERLQPTDIRDETCTNLSIFLSLLMRKIQSGETIPLLATRNQLIQTEEILTEHGLYVHHEPRTPDILIMVTRPE